MFKLKKELIEAIKSIDITLGGIENKFVQLVNDTSGITANLTNIERNIYNISQAFSNIDSNPRIALDIRNIEKI